MERDRRTIEKDKENSRTKLSARNNLNNCSSSQDAKLWNEGYKWVDKDVKKVNVETPMNKLNNALKFESRENQNVIKLISTSDQINMSESSDKL